ncbi:hypothetical protein RDI58_006135 [Solanum bulbocastanum]|uniref:Reverse transcriptase zinc-binding domain-containing protein n=1 Tax=Solanum bulbocastanum TaxID=147425 RepID=A0AAN8YN88_SOLBU
MITRFAQPEHRFILWLAMQDRLLTKERLNRLTIPVENDTCCLCEKSVEETHIHMFSTCEWIVRVQIEMQHWSGILISADTVKHILNRLRRKNWKQFHKELIAALCGAMIYQVWRARNWKLFKDITINTNTSVTQIKKEFVDRLENHQGNLYKKKV